MPLGREVLRALGLTIEFRNSRHWQSCHDAVAFVSLSPACVFVFLLLSLSKHVCLYVCTYVCMCEMFVQQYVCIIPYANEHIHVFTRCCVCHCAFSSLPCKAPAVTRRCQTWWRRRQSRVTGGEYSTFSNVQADKHTHTHTQAPHFATGSWLEIPNVMVSAVLSSKSSKEKEPFQEQSGP